MAWALAATAMLALVCVVALLRLRSVNRALAAENRRWRMMARERADQVAMLSHELRTPLALVGGAAELLSDGAAGELTAEQAELVETVAANTERMHILSEDLLADAQIDAGLFTMRMTMVDLRRLAQQVVRDVRRLEQAPLRLETRGAPPRVAADPAMMRQVLLNLVNNAVRHAGPGAQVTVRLRTTEDAVLLSVSDSGIGMSDQTRRVIFARGREAKSETGHGLGMIISKRIVELHGGRMMVDSISGHGTTVTVALPDAAHDRDEEAP